tara:strand:- start:77 stop:532 length:456 start_codon:yes stop_codon:yes gene_type:complete
MLSIKIQENDFDPGAIFNSIALGRKDFGAKVLFTGVVKDFHNLKDIEKLFIEHYPIMAEKQLKKICEDTFEKWKIMEIHLVHRYGLLKPGDNIVNLVVVSKGREEALEGAKFIMDYLKSDAPFWKKEYYPEGQSWVTQKIKDVEKLIFWEK